MLYTCLIVNYKLVITIISLSLLIGSDSDSQLELIVDMLGTPAIEDMDHLFSPRAKTRLLSVTRPNRMQERLYQLSPNASHGIVHLLSRMLVFNPVSEGERGNVF